MRLHDVADTYSEFSRSCCTLDAADDARRVAGQLGIPFYALNLERELERGVLRPFLTSFLEKKEIKASDQMAENLADEMAKHYEEKRFFVKINHQTWTVNKQEFITATPGDPF